MVLRFCKGDEELRGTTVCWAFLLWIEVLWISGTKVCGFFCGSATATAATERLFEALRVNNVEVLFVEDKVELGVTPVCS